MAVQALAVWLETFHLTMPNLLVGKKDRDDVIAYIMSHSRLPRTDTRATCRRQTCAWVQGNRKMRGMKIGKWFVASSMVTITSIASAFAQPGVSDPSHGRELADRLCSICHEVEPGSKETLTDIPTFSSIANRPDQSAERLAGAIILSPHPEMPKAALTNRELRDIISYLMSLRAKD